MLKKFIAFLKNPLFIKVYLLILLLFVLLFFYLHGKKLLTVLDASEPQMFILALIPYFVTVGIVTPYLHRIAYRESGSMISFWQAFQIFHLSRIGNYLPGKIWFATNYYLFSKRLNIGSVKIVKNFVVLNALLLIVGSLCSLPLISLFNPAIQKLLIVFSFLMLALIHPKILNKTISLFLKSNTEKDFRYIFLLKIGMFYFIAYIILGISLYLCILAFTIVDFYNIPFIIAAGASSFVISRLAIFAPAGIGVSEGINAAILSQFIPIEIAVIVVVALRAVMILVDLGCASVSAVSIARQKRNDNYS